MKRLSSRNEKKFENNWIGLKNDQLFNPEHAAKTIEFGHVDIEITPY